MNQSPCRPLLLIPLITAMSLSGQVSSPARLGSTVYKFEDLAVKPTGVGERRDVANQPTATLERFECHISTLNPAQASHPPHTHPQEELIILREGVLDVNANGRIQRAGPGSVFFFRSNQPHALQNNGEEPATYFVFNFATARTPTAPAIGAPVTAGELGSTVLDWTQLPVKVTKTGERREVLDAHTATLARFECHVTTLNAGLAPHPAHHHSDEEIVLVKEGVLEVTLKGVTTRAGPGSIVFCASNEEHGWRNAGTTPATYYVMRVITEATPKPEPKVAPTL